MIIDPSRCRFVVVLDLSLGRREVWGENKKELFPGVLEAFNSVLEPPKRILKGLR